MSAATGGVVYPVARVGFHLGKPILVMLAIAVAAGVVIALRPAPARPDLRVWTFAEPHREAFEPLAERYARATGLTVDVDLVQTRALNVRLESSFMSGDAAELPDLAEVEIGYVGRYFRPPVDQIGFVDLTDRVTSAPWYDRIVKQRFAPWSKNGRIFGVPHDVHPVALAYRDDLFREAGIDLGAPRTWAELHAALLAFRDYWRNRGVPHRHAIELPTTTAESVVVMLQQRGVNLIDDRDVIHLAGPKVAETVAFYAQMVAGAGNVATVSTGGPGSFARDLQEGNVCAFVTPDWRVADLRRYGAVSGDPSRDLTGKMRLRPLPVFDPTDAPTATWGGTMMGIPKGTRDVDAAWRLLEYLYVSDDALAGRRGADILPPIRAAWTGPGYDDPDPFFGGQRARAVMADLAARIPTRYVTPATPIATASLASVVARAVADVRDRGGDDGHLVARCQAWLDREAADVRRRIDHWNH